MQRFVKKPSGVISGERSTRGIGTVLTGRKPDDQKPGVGITEGRYRSAEIVRELCLGDIQKPGKPGAFSAVRVVAIRDFFSCCCSSQLVNFTTMFYSGREYEDFSI